MAYRYRLLFAYEECRLTFERRGNFISDDDILDTAEHWTTSRPTLTDDGRFNGYDNDNDLRRLINDLHDEVFAN